MFVRGDNINLNAINNKIAKAERAKVKAKRAIKEARLAKPELFGRWLLDNCRPVKTDNDGNVITTTVTEKDADGNAKQKNIIAHRYLSDLDDFNKHYLIIDKGGLDDNVYQMGEYVKNTLHIDNVKELRNRLNNDNNGGGIPFQNKS